MKTRQMSGLLAGLLVLGNLSQVLVHADIVTLDSDQSDYTFAGTNTYYITSDVYISGTSTFEGGAVIKYGDYGSLTVDYPDCQGNSDHPVVFTTRDDDRYGAVLPGSTGSPSSYYGLALGLTGSSDITIHDMQFNYAAIALGYYGSGSEYALWNVKIQDCSQAVDSESGGDFGITNLTIINCPGGIVGHYMIGGHVVDSTFINVGGLAFDDEGYGEYGFTFSWCTFSNSSLGAFEVNISGDHNGFADCGQFSDYMMASGWSYGTNYFGSDWYWLTNSAIGFWLHSTNHYVQQHLAPVQVRDLYGTVFYQAVLINNTNFDSAVWTDYTGTNLLVDLGSTNNGDYTVWVGLKGARDVDPVWQSTVVTIDPTAPILSVTSPVLFGHAATVGMPLVEVQGAANKFLAALTYDLSNAVQVVTNRNVVITDRFFDTNRFDFTTNYFQCYDVVLTNGLNLITLHATDRAGNTTTTNVALTLDYSVRTNGVNVQLVFPQDGMRVCGSSFTVNGSVDDPTATITAQTVAGGTTNTFLGVVERDGRFWVDGMPLGDGTNHLVLTVADAAGNVLVTNIAVIHDSTVLTMNAITGGQLWNSNVTASGTVSDPDCVVWVNGVQATNEGGSWMASGVPLNKGGVAIFNVTAYPPGEAPPTGTGNGSLNPPNVNARNVQLATDKPVGLRLQKDYLAKTYHYSTLQDAWDQNQQQIWHYCLLNDVTANGHEWADGIGWNHYDWTWFQTGAALDEDGNYVTNPPTVPLVNEGTNSTWPYTPWFSAPYFEHYDAVWQITNWPTEYYDSGGNYWNNHSGSTTTYASYSRWKLVSGGRGIVGNQVLHEIYGWALHNNYRPWNYPDFHRLPNEAVRIASDTLRDDPTFSEGNDLGTLYLVAEAGTERDATPSVDDDKSYVFVVADLGYPLRVTANGSDVTTVTNVEFSVGQTVNLYTSWQGAMPPNVVDVPSVHWHLPGKYVNNFYYPCDTCSMTYEASPNMLTNWSTTAWYLRDIHQGVCSIGARLHMSNGQYVNVAAAGQFSIYRPTVTFPAHPVPTMIPMLTNSWLELGNAESRGGNNEGIAQFDVTITSKAPFAGEATWTQLIRRSLPANPSDTGGQFNLKSPSDTIDESVSFSGVLGFSDSPGLASWPGFWTLRDDYKNYVQFRPSDGILVTLGVVSWGWSAKEYDWALTESSTTPPTYQDSDEFPQWTQ